jgi:flagellar biosynthesis/type III secretory pathway protein FliH
MFAASPAWAKHKPQQDQSENKTASSSEAETQDKNLQEYIALLRSNVRQQKAEIMGAIMLLSASDAAKFWPIYSDYDAQLTKLNDERAANIQEYARAYDQMTDERADDLIQKALAYQNERTELLVKTYQRVKEAVGATTAARFIQVEHQLLLIIDLQIASALPLVGQGS